MRILIIGGTGFSGPLVVRRLVDMGHEVILFHRGKTEADLPEGVRHVLGHRERWGDSANDLRGLAPQVVAHMIPVTEQDAQGVMSTFQGIARRVVALSSQDVYRAYGKLINIEPGPIEPGPLAEESPLRTRLYPYRDQVAGPDHPLYHYEKILVERVVMGNPELPGTILRLPMVYGPRDYQHRLFAYLKRMDDQRPAIVMEEGLANWRWTKGYVENVAQAIVLAITDDRAAGRVYNVGERETLSESDWVRAIGAAAGWGGQVVVAPKNRLPAGLAPSHNTDQHLLVDTTRIRQELGYVESVPRDEALRRTIAWERAHPPEKMDSRAFDYATEDALLSELGWRAANKLSGGTIC